MNSNNQSKTTRRIFTWISFVILIGLIIWGLIAANNKSARENDLLPLPDQITATDHIKGSATAPVTLVEYGDFQCPACGQFYPIVEKLLAEEGSSTIRFVFRHFPLTQHPNAIPAALAGEAASNQGKFWEMFGMIYENQAEWSELSDAKPIFIGYATKLGLDIKKFQADMALKETETIVTNGYKSGVKAHLQGTPTFFVNGKQISNPQSYDAFKKIIDDTAQSQPRS
jgi:formate-nitrite transporter family protein